MKLKLFFLFIPCLIFAQKKDSIYAFIGNVIDYKKVDYYEHYQLNNENGPIIFDEMFVTKVKVIKWLNNDIKMDTIEFVSFDHYGKPDFLSVEHPILYLGFNKKKKEFYQYKYQFDVAYQLNNEWFGIYHYRDFYINKFLKNVKSISVKIPFKLPEKFNIKNEELVERYFPKEYYSINNNSEAFILKLFRAQDLANVRMNSLTLR